MPTPTAAGLPPRKRFYHELNDYDRIAFWANAFNFPPAQRNGILGGFLKFALDLCLIQQTLADPIRNFIKNRLFYACDSAYHLIVAPRLEAVRVKHFDNVQFRVSHNTEEASCIFFQEARGFWGCWSSPAPHSLGQPRPTMDEILMQEGQQLHECN